MGLRILAILLTLQALIGPSISAALACAPMVRPNPSETCCVSCCCAGEAPCGCSMQEAPDNTAPRPDPATPARGGEELARILALPARAHEAILSASGFDWAHRESVHGPDTPAALMGRSAQSVLCIRTT